jgi:hypothetical protein
MFLALSVCGCSFLLLLARPIVLRGQIKRNCIRLGIEVEMEMKNKETKRLWYVIEDAIDWIDGVGMMSACEIMMGSWNVLRIFMEGFFFSCE